LINSLLDSKQIDPEKTRIKFDPV